MRNTPNWSVVRLDERALRANYFTPCLQWLDAVDVVFVRDEPAAGGALRADARSASTSLCPASNPCAVPFGVLLCWVPFGDSGKNVLHLEDVRRLLDSRGQVVEGVEHVSVGLSNVRQREVAAEHNAAVPGPAVVGQAVASATMAR